MLRRVGWTLLSAVIGYILAIVVTFVVLSVAYESRVNRLAVRPDRDRWAFLGALAGTVVGGVAGWWWSGRRPATEDEADHEVRADEEAVDGAAEPVDDDGAADPPDDEPVDGADASLDDGPSGAAGAVSDGAEPVDR
ncbi:MAG: hypothetical protein U0Q07_08780 [Acidimicrobiales bacterium]